MLTRLRELARRRVNFAFETTLASRSFAPWLSKLVVSGYAFHLVFLWLPSPDLAVSRVADRVRFGGHGVPEEIIRRRYHTGLVYFFSLYRPLSTIWRIYDNSSGGTPRRIASGRGSTTSRVYDRQLWRHLEELYSHADLPPGRH